MIVQNIPNKVIGMIKQHEGFRDKPYRCTAGKLTIGYGRNLDDVGISNREATILLYNDIIEATESVRVVFSGFEFDEFSENRQAALIDMMFNLGRSRFMKFKKMITAIRCKDWNEAADQAKDSRWFYQVGERGVKIVRLLMEG